MSSLDSPLEAFAVVLLRWLEGHTVRAWHLQAKCAARQLTALHMDGKYCLQTHSCTDVVQSEYAPDCDARRQFISRFTGSAGTAVVTANVAALWTDGRYFLQVLKSTRASDHIN